MPGHASSYDVLSVSTFSWASLSTYFSNMEKKVLKPSIVSTQITCHRYNVNLCKTVQEFKAHYITNVPEGTTALVESGTVQLGWLGSRAAQLISINSHFSLVSSVNAPGHASNLHWRLDFKTSCKSKNTLEKLNGFVLKGPILTKTTLLSFYCCNVLSWKLYLELVHVWAISYIHSRMNIRSVPTVLNNSEIVFSYWILNTFLKM